MINTQLVLGCVHIPFHNKKLLNGVFQLIKDIKPQGLNLIGDIYDCNSLNFHDRGQTPILDVVTEYKMGKVVMDEFHSVTKSIKEKRFVYGNHEDRYLRHQRLPDSKRIMHEPPEEHFRLRENGYEVKTNVKDDYFTLGSYLDIFHGELLGVNPAKRQLDKSRNSVMFAHSHRLGSYYDTNKASFNIGGLFDRNAQAFKYAGRLVRAGWQNGFGIVYIDTNGYYSAQLITCSENGFIFNGKKYGK